LRRSGLAIGPTVGGILTQYLSWHWIFFINVPVGIFAILLGAKVIPSTTPPVAARVRLTRQGPRLPSWACIACLCRLGGRGAALDIPNNPRAAVLAIVTLGLFIRQELGHADPLLDLRLFKSRNFFLANLLLFLVFFSFSGISYLLPFYLEYVHSYSTSNAGLIMTSLSLR